MNDTFTQNRDSQAIQLELGELIRATTGAHNELIDLESRNHAEIDHLGRELRK